MQRVSSELAERQHSIDVHTNLFIVINKTNYSVRDYPVRAASESANIFGKFTASSWRGIWNWVKKYPDDVSPLKETQCPRTL